MRQFSIFFDRDSNQKFLLVFVGGPYLLDHLFLFEFFEEVKSELDFLLFIRVDDERVLTEIHHVLPVILRRIEENRLHLGLSILEQQATVIFLLSIFEVQGLVLWLHLKHYFNFLSFSQGGTLEAYN